MTTTLKTSVVRSREMNWGGDNIGRRWLIEVDGHVLYRRSLTSPTLVAAFVEKRDAESLARLIASGTRAVAIERLLGHAEESAVIDD